MFVSVEVGAVPASFLVVKDWIEVVESILPLRGLRGYAFSWSFPEPFWPFPFLKLPRRPRG